MSTTTPPSGATFSDSPPQSSPVAGSRSKLEDGGRAGAGWKQIRVAGVGASSGNERSWGGETVAGFRHDGGGVTYKEVVFLRMVRRVATLTAAEERASDGFRSKVVRRRWSLGFVPLLLNWLVAVDLVVVSYGEARPNRILVVGSANLDTTIEVERLPRPGETVTSRSAPSVCAGGKGLNQAVAAARLGDGSIIWFAGRVGNDACAEELRAVLRAEGVDVRHVASSPTSSGQGIVVLAEGGEVLSVVVRGANHAWSDVDVDAVEGCEAVLLQREIPSDVNAQFAAAAKRRGAIVFLDAGGEDTDALDQTLMSHVDYLTPNLTELARLVGVGVESLDTDDAVARAAASLRERFGPRLNVLATLGSRGSLLVASDGAQLREPAMPAPRVVDETAAGDSFRAAFAVSLVAGSDVAASLRFASAAGALAVSRSGAVPSLPTRTECLAALRGGAAEEKSDDDECPWRFASRLNSMKDRRDLASTPDSPLGWVARQGEIPGLDLVDFNYPQHLAGLEVDEVKAALRESGLECGAVCLRYPRELFRPGSFTHHDPEKRAAAIELTIEAAKWARELGASEVCVWSAFDGYDYSMQVDYVQLWDRVVRGFREVCDACPDVKVSLEFKPTDENTRFFAVPSTGAALLLARQVDRPNFGLTLDVGHVVAAGENPAQSVALVGSAGKLFGVQLNDAWSKIGAEDGLVFGSVHATAALEFVLWLQKVNFDGHVYFDTFPRNEDPVRECAFNIRRVKTLYARAKRLTAAGLDACLARHDAMATLELLDRMGFI